MVLRDANMHALVDDGDGRDIDIGAMQDHHAVSAVLQLSERVREESGMELLIPNWLQKLWSGAQSEELAVDGGNCADLRSNPVLAPPLHVPLLWPSLARPHLPRLLPATLFETVGRVFRALCGTFHMAFALRDCQPVMSLALAVHTIPWPSTEQQLGIYMVTAESRDKIEFLGATGVYSAVPAVGIDGV